MPLVMNWKPPKGINTVETVQEFFRERGVEITIAQVHRVSSGKLNTTFVGDDKEIIKVWKIIKDFEKEEMINRYRQKGK